VGCEVLEGLEPGAELSCLVDGQHAAVTIERGDGVPQGEVAGGPGARSREMPSEKPVGRPLADSREPRELRLDLVVGEGRERMQVEVGACELQDVSGLAAREAEAGEILG